MDYNAAALEMHAKYPGKLTVNSLFEVKDRDALSTAYTPGVAEPCRQIKANPDDVYKYTFKGRTVAVVTNGTAVLGLGNIGPEAGLPVMEGKCVLFKEFGGVDAFPICLNASTREEVIAAVKAIAPTFGGINLEDIRSPECFDIEAELERDLDIPVFMTTSTAPRLSCWPACSTPSRWLASGWKMSRSCRTAPALPVRPSSRCCRLPVPKTLLLWMNTVSCTPAARRALPTIRNGWQP